MSPKPGLRTKTVCQFYKKLLAFLVGDPIGPQDFIGISICTIILWEFRYEN